jgi:hypothetical protein
MISGRYEYDLMATKRNDPDYEQVSGYVHKDLALKFRIICMTERITQSELLEEALKILIELKDKTNSLPLTADRPDGPQPTEPKPAIAAKAKRGKAGKSAS